MKNAAGGRLLLKFKKNAAGGVLLKFKKNAAGSDGLGHATQ
jgi:hypothetical protein